MRLRPLNDTLIVEPDPILRYQGNIIVPDKNSEEKRSPYGTLVSWGDRCFYKNYYKVGQRIVMPSVNAEGGYSDKAVYAEVEGKTYRLIVESRVHATLED